MTTMMATKKKKKKQQHYHSSFRTALLLFLGLWFAPPKSNGFVIRSRIVRLSRNPRVSGIAHASKTSPRSVSTKPESEDESSSTSSTTPPSSSIPLEAVRLRNKLLELGVSTNRGFQSTREEKRRARDLIDELARFNPSNTEPLAPYYKADTATTTSFVPHHTLTGKWTLVYTDAPDITGLDTSRVGQPSLPPLAELGRIGQDCVVPPTIKNVIEWRRPSWAAVLPFSGSEDSRILQKVVVEGTASPDKPFTMNLKLLGIEVTSAGKNRVDSSGSEASLRDALQQNGLPVAWLERNPVELGRGPSLTPSLPFGEFELLYLDDTMRIIQTGQNFVAVNLRDSDGDAWF